jgi:hypothetical protein
MWEPRRLKTLLVSTACYRDSFTFLLHVSFETRCTLTGAIFIEPTMTKGTILNFRVQSIV